MPKKKGEQAEIVMLFSGLFLLLWLVVAAARSHEEQWEEKKQRERALKHHVIHLFKKKSRHIASSGVCVCIRTLGCVITHLNLCVLFEV